MRKILMVGPLPPTVGGITTFILGVLRSDLRTKYAFDTFGTERPTFRMVRQADLRNALFRIGFRHLIKSVWATIVHLFHFPLVLHTTRSDIVHIHTTSYHLPFWENTFYCVLSKLWGKRVIQHVHGGAFKQFYERSHPIAQALIRRSLSLADTVIVLSQMWKRFFTQLVPESKIHVLANFVDTSQFQRKTNAHKARTNVLFVGGGSVKIKGIYDVFKAVPLALKTCEDLHFTFVACSGIAQPATFTRGKISPHITFKGYVHGDEKIRVFTDSDLLLIPSYWEGFPMTMLEAMAAGLPIIATPVGAIPEVIEDGINGFLINTGDYRALAEKIVTLTRDESLRRQIAANNLRKVRQRYDVAPVMRKLDALYRQILAG